nr:hypothetical protein [uncultured Pseudodesulfovibrio sp.]
MNNGSNASTLIFGPDGDTDKVAQEVTDWLSTCSKEELEASLHDPELEVAQKMKQAKVDDHEE